MIAWTHDSGTHELPALRIGLPLADQHTAELSGIPSHPSRHQTSAVARVAIHTGRVARRMARSQAARDLADWAFVMALLLIIGVGLWGGDWLHLHATGGVR